MTHPAFDADWDTIVIGTGMGGGTLGRALAEAGQRVLFIEQGHSGPRSAQNGIWEAVSPEARLENGLWPHPLHVTLEGRQMSFHAPLGAGLGGSSVFYAATLERPERHDLDDFNNHPTGGWPVGFDAFQPWYEKAAALYRVYGTPDPLSPEPSIPLRDPPALTATERVLMSGFISAGLHPYHAHTAIERHPGCRMCLGRRCPEPCKMDGRSAGVEPALATGRAAVLDRAEVLRIVAEGDAVRHLVLRHDGQERRISAPRYVLAAGALGSARLLLASAAEGWSTGLANRSGLVGRNLMFHLNEMFALWPGRSLPDDGPTKAISLRDLYHRDGQRFGTVQAMGLRASYGEIVHFLNRMLAESRVPMARRLQPLSRLPAVLAAQFLGHAQVFVGLLEDMPYAENRVTHNPGRPDRLSVVYRFQPELLHRRRAFRRAIRRAFRNHRQMFLTVSPELNYGHPCGTLRFGEDRWRSVLRPDCRTHDISNLWVADSSFMPSAMGVNPSLTIAANALRVADEMLRPVALPACVEATIGAAHGKPRPHP